MIKEINQLFKVKHIEITIENFGNLLKINKLFSDEFSQINFRYFYYRSSKYAKYSKSKIMDNPDWINFKFIQICQLNKLSPDEFQFLWKVLSSKRTRFNLTSISLRFSLLSECLTVLSLCSGCPELQHVKLHYFEADAENEDEAVEHAQREFRQNFGFIQVLSIRKESQ